MKIKNITEKYQRKWNVEVHKIKEIRAICAARDMVHCSSKSITIEFMTIIMKFYKQIVNRQVNVQPVQEEVVDKRPHFKILYMCYATCKDSFKLCTLVIDLDGCFLKGLYGGKILVLIGIDHNDQMLPIAFVVVEGETKDNLTWFLELLIDDLGGRIECHTYSFMS